MASAIILMDSLSAGGIREQAEREQRLYEERLNALSDERDKRMSEALAAQERFTVALEQVSEMQMRFSPRTSGAASTRRGSRSSRPPFAAR